MFTLCCRVTIRFLLLVAISVSTEAFLSTKSITILTKLTAINEFPDYGKTPVEIDQIQINAKPWRRKDLFGTSLVEQTLANMVTTSTSSSSSSTSSSSSSTKLSKQERIQQRRSLNIHATSSFSSVLQANNIVLQRKTPKILQLNVGLYCNQACAHCHVESSPLRTTEVMSSAVAAQCLQLLQATPSITTLDLTGGAPELHQAFRYLVRMARQLRPDLEIIDRCNLTVLQEPKQEDLVDFLKEHNVRIIASLPCYSAENVNQQRGAGVFERSIAALLALNDAGYGMPGSHLKLDLIYNPLGAFLPPEQEKLELQYKQQLHDNFGILFNSLFAMTNMPIKRFADYLHRRQELKEYMDLLVRNFNPETTQNLMCLDTISVSYDGTIYDCDFNQQLGFPIAGSRGDTGKLSVFDLEDLNELLEYRIRMDNHCFGCTSGKGSSCQGTTA